MYPYHFAHTLILGMRQATEELKRIRIVTTLAADANVLLSNACMQGTMASVLDLCKYHALHPLSDEAIATMHAEIEQLVEEQRMMGDAPWHLTVISPAGQLSKGSMAALDAYCACVRRDDWRPLNARCIELTITETPESHAANGFMQHDVYQFASLFKSIVPDVFPVLEALSFRYSATKPLDTQRYQGDST